MIEVEIRAKVPDFNEIISKLNKLGAKFLKEEEQIDRIFGNDKFLDKNKMIVEGGIVARLRTVNNNTILEFKEVSRQGAGFEIKSNISDVPSAIKLLEKLEFEESFSIHKKRKKYSCDSFLICLDDVTSLGTYIEIEKTVDSSQNIAKTKEECLFLLKKIAPNATIEQRKYGDLIQDKLNKAK